jgi:hypothetical protein
MIAGSPYKALAIIFNLRCQKHFRFSWNIRHLIDPTFDYLLLRRYNFEPEREVVEQTHEFAEGLLVPIDHLLNFQFPPNTDIPFDLGNLIRGAKIKALGRTDGDTSRFQALIDSIHAVVALDCLLRIWVPLERTPGAGRNTCLAACTVCFVDKNNAVGPDLNGPDWTSVRA